MKIAYFDCFSGASGDMILGALIDAGVDIQALREGLEELHLSGYDLEVSRVRKGAIEATDVQVVLSDQVTERKISTIEEIIGRSKLPGEIKETSTAIFRRLVTVEAGIHGIPPEDAHLHEVGGTDAIIDVVGALLGLRLLGVEKVYASRLPLGNGFVRCAHGLLPLPAPATLELLKGVPVAQVDVEGELVTPTGAAILTALVEEFGHFPEMSIESIGYGAGKSELPFANLLRVLIGTTIPQLGESREMVVLLETNLDDMNPEFYDHIIEALFAADALDVYLQPIQAKKNRPGVLLSVLCHPQAAEELSSIIFAETTTLGIRQQTMERTCLNRETVKVKTPLGNVRIKVAKLGDRIINLSPEYEDCRRLALEKKKPLKEVYAAAEVAARRWRETAVASSGKTTL
jgi:uncharacterized protein (TIGR00299 family) protein